MRGLLAIGLLAAHVMIVSSDEVQPVEAVPWMAPFASFSSAATTAGTSDLAVLLLVTNDDPFITASPDLELASENATGEVTATPKLWCVPHLERAYRQLVEVRPEFKNRLKIQGIAAGVPKELTGGEPRNLPARAVLGLCDPQYRLLGLHIGVPRGDELISIVEDAEEVATLRQLRSGDDKQSSANAPIAQRSRERLDRMWVSVLDDLLRSDHEQDADSEKPLSRSDLVYIGEALEAAYLADVRRRFGLSDASDHARLVLLEQHLETRQPWCDSMIALTSGEDFSLIWRDLVEQVWRYPPITGEACDVTLRDWVNLHRKSDLIVLGVQPPAHAQRFPWPPLADVVTGRVQPWRTAHDKALTFPFRNVDVEQLARLLHEFELDPIDIQQPSLARYVLLEPNKNRPLVICETDSPTRLAKRLKRSDSNINQP